MPDERNNPFADYAPEPQTSAQSVGTQSPDLQQTGTAKYGVSKPHRSVVRGIIAKDTGPDKQGD